MSIDQSSVDRVMGADVHGSDGQKIGQVGQVYLDDVSGVPQWVSVKTGMFGTKETFVPLAQADLDTDGLRVPYDKDTVKDAPAIDADHHISRQEEAELYRHYGLDVPEGHHAGADGDRRQDDGDRRQDDVDQRADRHAARERDRGDDGERQRASGSAGDEAMTRSEEQLSVGTRSEETGRARLRKYVVTEEETVTVPVSKEKVVLEREPVTDAGEDRGGAGARISEEEHEVVLHEETPVVTKEAVPVERVRLGKETVTEQEQVTESVRKEQIDTDGVDAVEDVHDDDQPRR